MIEIMAGVATLTASAALVLCGISCHVAAAGDTSTPARFGSTDVDTNAAFGGPSSGAAQIQSDDKPKASVFDIHATTSTFQRYYNFKEQLPEEYGLAFGIDYNMLLQHASESLGKETAAGGGLRFFGSWTVLGEETGTPASIEFKVENRHHLGTDIAPQALAGEIRYAGLTAVPFTDAGWLLTNLYWHPVPEREPACNHRRHRRCDGLHRCLRSREPPDRFQPPNWNVRYPLKTPDRDGTTHVMFEPRDFITGLAALAPKPRVNLTRL